MNAMTQTSPAIPSPPFARYITKLSKHNLASYYDQIDIPICGTAFLPDALAQSRARWPERKLTVATISDGVTCSLPTPALFCAVHEPFWFDRLVKPQRLKKVASSLGEVARRSARQNIATDRDATFIEMSYSTWFRFDSLKLGRAIIHPEEGSPRPCAILLKA